MVVKEFGSVYKDEHVRKKAFNESLYKYLAIIIGIFVVAAFVWSNMPLANTVSKSMQTTTEVSTSDTSTGAATSSQANNAGQETIIDPYGNQVDQKDIINIGIVPVVKPMDGLPPHLVRAGIMDLQVNVESGHNIVVNFHDAPAQRNTYVRVKVLDEKGVVIFKDNNGKEVDYIELYGKKGAGVGQSIYDHNPRTLSGEIKQMQVLVYFVDNKYQSKSPPKINV